MAIMDGEKEPMLIRGAREILLPLLILIAFNSLARFVPLHRTTPNNAVSSQIMPRTVAWQQPAPMDIGKDPHFRVLLENPHVRVFALTLPPHSESFVWQEYNYLTVTLVDSNVVMWKEQESPILHYRAPKGEIHFLAGASAHGIRNETNAEYRNVTIEFLDPGITNYGYRYETGKYDFGPSGLDPPPVDPQGHFVQALNLERAEAKDIQLLPRESFPADQRSGLLVAVTPLHLAAGPQRAISLNSGEVAWLDNLDAGLANNGASRARFALVEFKPTDKN
ncbi:MAG: hypothetical protein WA738_00740 [Candidatus Angelobacter sp.]